MGLLPSARHRRPGKVAGPTETDIIGPFYRFGAPLQTRLARAQRARGSADPDWYVLARGRKSCQTPVPGALIEVWQANHAGMYDTAKPGNFTEGGAFHLRGMLYTNERGQYEIDTIVPGRYPIPPNLPGLEKYAGLTRPAHIHFRVIESLHVPITTQLYFKGDPFIAGDPWASRKPGLAVDLRRDGTAQRGVFDFVLTRGL